MTKLVCTKPTNCWQAFLSCALDLPLSMLSPCSTENANWKQKTDELFERFDQFIVEVKPDEITELPGGALVGAHVEGPNGLPHVVVAAVLRSAEQQSFIVHHDPSGFYQPATPIDPSTVVLLCRLIR